jgi:hypothetical protein
MKTIPAFGDSLTSGADAKTGAAFGMRRLTGIVASYPFPGVLLAAPPVTGRTARPFPMRKIRSRIMSAGVPRHSSRVLGANLLGTKCFLNEWLGNLDPTF